MLSFQSKTGAQLTLQFAWDDSNVQNYFGLPIDPSSGTNTPAKLLSGVNRFLDTYGSDYRSARRPEYRALLTAPQFDHVALRLAARFTDFDVAALQNLPTVNAGGAVDPLTG